MFGQKANLSSTHNRTTIKYYEIIQRDIDDLTHRLNRIIRNRDLAIAMIVESRDKVMPNKLLEYCINLKNGIKKHDYMTLVKTFNYLRKHDTQLDILKIEHKNTDVEKLVRIYYNNVYSYTIDERNLSDRINNLTKLLTINGKAIRHIHKTYFKLASYNMLKGNELYLFGDISANVRGKSRLVNQKKYNRNIAKVDWKASILTLIAISKDLNLDFGTKYINKELSKKDLISSMKPHVYSKSSPNKPKWLVYDNKNFDFWLDLFKTRCKLENSSDYNIVPTNYIMNETKSQIDFTNNCKSVDDIIYSDLLGMRDKIKALERFDVNYCFRTFKHNIN